MVGKILTEKDLQEIHIMIGHGLTYRQIAKMFKKDYKIKISHTAIFRNYKKWLDGKYTTTGSTYTTLPNTTTTSGTYYTGESDRYSLWKRFINWVLRRD